MEALFGSREPTRYLLGENYKENQQPYDQEDEINSRISAQDDMYDEEKARKSLGIVNLYRNSSDQMQFMVINLLGAQLVAQKILIDVVNLGGQLLFDRYIDVKIPDTIIDGTNELCAKALITALLEGDDFSTNCEEDEEPVYDKI